MLPLGPKTFREGDILAYKERRILGYPVKPVELVKKGPARTQKVKVKWLDGEYESLEEWVPKSRLVAYWEEASALMEDEKRQLRAIELSGDVSEYDVEYRAIKEVFFALPLQYEVGLGHRKSEHVLFIIDEFESDIGALGLNKENLLAVEGAYIDRFGRYIAPYSVAKDCAFAFCQRFSIDIMRTVGRKESVHQKEITTGYSFSILTNSEHWISREDAEARYRKELPVFELIRKWCGNDAVEQVDRIRELEKEVDRLRAMINDLVAWLQFNGHPVKASRLLKELENVRR